MTKKKKFVYFFSQGKSDGSAQLKMLLGGKGANLAEMCSIGLPVPPGFTITTEVCKLYYDNKRKYPTALDYYHRAIDLSPSDAMALRGLGRTYAAMGRFEESIKALEKATHHAPYFAEAHYDLATVYRDIGEYKKALTVFDKVVQLVPESRLAKDAALSARQIRER